MVYFLRLCACVRAVYIYRSFCRFSEHYFFFLSYSTVVVFHREKCDVCASSTKVAFWVP